MQLGKTIAKLRKDRGWSQKDFAAQLHTTQKVISDYETGKSKPPIERLPDIASALGVTVDMLLGVQPIQEQEKQRRIHGNSRLAKIYELLDREWKPAEERSILSHIRGLIAQRDNPDIP